MKRTKDGKGKAKIPISEKAFQKQVIQLAQLLGWRVAHFRPALSQSGRWMTAVQGDGVGFPDLVLVRSGQLIFAELKSDDGRVSDPQREWLAALETVCGIEVHVWRPVDWPEIERALGLNQPEGGGM